MKLEGICFNKNKTFSGAFQLPDGSTYFGKLFYKQNEQCDFLIYMDNIKSNENHYNEIIATLSDEDESIYFVNLFDCRMELSSFGTANSFCGYFNYALFSKQRHFDSNKDNINEKINIIINNWAEFCFPQGYKMHAEFQPRMNNFRLRNNMRISFNQDIRGHYISENHIFNSLFVNWGLSEDQVNNIEQQLNQVLIPHREHMGIKNVEKHKWYIRVENISNKFDINLVGYYLTAMMMCFTHDFGSKIEKIEVISKDVLKNATIPIVFDYLDYRNIITKETKYKYRNSAFNLNTFNDSEWQTILNNLFSKHKILEPFFDILYQNYYENKLSEYHLERYIDCIAAIGNNKKYGDIKYEKVIKDFVDDFDKDIKNQLLIKFRECLNTITAKNKKKPKRNWGLIGKKICELRAMTTHFNDTSKRVNMGRFILIYFILELIITDYIFEILGISLDKRLAYKMFYTKQLLNI